MVSPSALASSHRGFHRKYCTLLVFSWLKTSSYRKSSKEHATEEIFQWLLFIEQQGSQNTRYVSSCSAVLLFLLRGRKSEDGLKTHWGHGEKPFLCSACGPRVSGGLEQCCQRQGHVPRATQSLQQSENPINLQQPIGLTGVFKNLKERANQRD